MRSKDTLQQTTSGPKHYLTNRKQDKPEIKATKPAQNGNNPSKQTQNQCNKPNYNPIKRNPTSIGIKQLAGFKQYMLKAELGHYFSHKWMANHTLKRIRHQQIGLLFKISGPVKQFQQTQKIVANQFQNVVLLQRKIKQRYRQTTPQHQDMQELQSHNYILEYEMARFDYDQGCFLIHQAIQMTLAQAIKRKIFSYQEKILIMQNMLNILQQLQQNNICHQNLNPFNLVFVRNKIRKQNFHNYTNNSSASLSNWKYDRNQHTLKVCGFYQFVYVHDRDDPNKKYFPILFQSPYTDPNIQKFKKPQFCSDLWSVGIIFYELFTGKLPNLSDQKSLDNQLDGMLNWQKDFFIELFKGTKVNNFKLKDFKLRFKNMGVTSKLTETIMKQQQNRRQEQKNASLWKSLKQQQSTFIRKRTISMFSVD